MSIFKRFQFWKFSKSRTEAFSDGVFAIVITLLVLEIKVPELPHDASSQMLMDALRDIWPKIISWVLSFFFVAVMWVQHHNIFRMCERSDYGMVWINNVFLLLLCFMPFPTALMGQYHNRLAVLLFGLDATLVSLVQITLYHYIAKNYLSPAYSKEKVLKNVRLAYILAPFMLLIATAVSFINITLPFIIYFIVPFFFLLPLDEETDVK